MLSLSNFLILVVGCSLAGFVDAVAGGGGLISLPAYLLTGIPIHFLLGTNKLTAAPSSVVSALTFFKHGKVTTKFMKLFMPMTALGAFLGVKTVVLMDQTILRPFIMVMILVVGVYTLFSKTIGSTNEFDESKVRVKHYVVGSLFTFSMGFYDGFFGPGTGSFLIMFFILYYKMDFITSSGNAKAVNLTSGVVSLIMFAIEGKVAYSVGLPIIIFVMVSTWFGAKFALKKGIKVIKPIFVTMSLIASLKLLFDMFF